MRDEKEIAMKRCLIMCKNCGFEEKREFYSQEDAEKRNMKLVSPRCKKCGSTNVRVLD
jgi:Zn finger protein HypA/HybF involved in hydrogenase expression